MADRWGGRRNRGKLPGKAPKRGDEGVYGETQELCPLGRTIAPGARGPCDHGPGQSSGSLPVTTTTRFVLAARDLLAPLAQATPEPDAVPDLRLPTDPEFWAMIALALGVLIVFGLAWWQSSRESRD
jgi:hypothetical protein